MTNTDTKNRTKCVLPLTVALLTICACVFAAAPHLQAAESLVDFSASQSTPGGLQGGNYWNTIGGTTTTDLLDAASGLDSGWDITVTLPGGTATGFGGTGINGDGAAAPFDQSFAIIDGIFSNRATAAGTATITLTNLEANAAYDFSTYSDRSSGWADGVISTTVGTGPTSVALLEDAVTSFGIISDGLGTIEFTFVEGPGESSPIGNNSVLNALSISGPPFAVVPEPSSIALTALALLSFGTIGWRRRRR